MDRQIVYPGAIPLETDLLNTNKNTMIGLSKLAAAILGTSTFLNGLACTPTGPASLQVYVAPGEIYSLQNIDGTAYSSIAADTTHAILKQGISLDQLTLSCPAPVTAGQSVNYLIQVAYQDADSGAVVLPYYNSSNPSQAYAGPANSGTAQNTVRKGVCAVSAKAGVAATTGTQATPAPDSGYIGAFVVTVAYGQAQITAPNISTYAGAPFLPSGGLVVGGLQGNACNISAAGGTADAITGSYTPGITALTNGMTLYIRAASANATTTPTFTPASGTIVAKTIVKGAGSALAAGDIAGGGHWIELQYDATLDKWVLLNPANGINYSTAASIQGVFKNLQASASGIGATVSVSADEIALETSGNAYVTRRGLSLSGALTTSGANGLDNTAPQAVAISIASPGVVTLNGHGFPANAPVVLSTTGALPTGLTAGTTYYVANPTANTFQLSATKSGSAINTSGGQSGIQTVASVLAASSWYSRWVIDNGTTQALLWSSSATNPVLPSGYTAKARCGWDITDGTANKYPLPFNQSGPSVTYAPGASKNLTSFGQVTSGVVGTYGATMASISMASYVPPTARKVRIILQQTSATNGGINVSSNAVTTAYTGNSPGYANMAALMGALTVEVPFESQGTVYMSAQANTNSYVTGYEENF